jgi:hypothetical protein
VAALWSRLKNLRRFGNRSAGCQPVHDCGENAALTRWGWLQPPAVCRFIRAPIRVLPSLTVRVLKQNRERKRAEHVRHALR